MSNNRARLGLSLSPDHPIFNYPAGQRATIAKEWMDIGFQLSQLNKKIDQLSNQVVNQEVQLIQPAVQLLDKEESLIVSAEVNNISKININNILSSFDK